MKTVNLAQALGAGIILCAAATPAQAVDPEIVYTWGVGVGTKPVYIHSSMPSLCDNPVLYGINVWNAVGAKFAFTWPSNPITAYRESEQTVTQDRASITIEPATFAGSTLMATNTNRASSTSYTLIDADIKVNENLLFYGGSGTGGEFHCAATANTTPPSNKVDYQSAMTHELGHALGFQPAAIGEYYDNPDCVMYYGLARGVINRTTCVGEYNEFRSAYGIR